MCPLPIGDIFAALSDPTRRQILRMLAQRGDLSAGEIATAFNMTKPSISHHLATLRHAGLVLSQRKGQNIIYSLDATVLQEAIAWGLEIMHAGERSGDGADHE